MYLDVSSLKGVTQSNNKTRGDIKINDRSYVLEIERIMFTFKNCFGIYFDNDSPDFSYDWCQDHGLERHRQIMAKASQQF